MSQASQEIWSNSARGRQESQVFSGYSATSSDFGSPKGRGIGPFSESNDGPIPG